MSDNIIYNSNDNTQIGYQKDLMAYLKTCLNEYAEQDEWENVEDIAELLDELGKWSDNGNLLVLSDNNGMGYTIKEYEKGD